jgi:hypothetical protein
MFRAEHARESSSLARGTGVGTNRLFVLWRAPEDGSRLVIGELWREADARYAFAYSEELPRAIERGFALLPEFPANASREVPYKSGYLFPTFAQRIPSPKRPDYRRILDAWGVEHDDDLLGILALSGGIQLTDRLELAEYRSSDDDLSRPLLFRIAGMKYQEPVQIVIGDHFDLRHDADNLHDTHAVVMLKHRGAKVGYVPRQYSRMVHRLVEAGISIETVALRELVVPADVGRWVVTMRAL